MGARVRGEMYRDETTLILDFSVVNSMGSSTHKEVRIPLADLRMISLRKRPESNLPYLLSASIPSKPELVIKVNDPASLAKLPAGQNGPGRLRVHPADVDATQQMVDSILRSPLLVVAPAERPVRQHRRRPQGACSPCAWLSADGSCEPGLGRRNGGRDHPGLQPNWKR